MSMRDVIEYQWSLQSQWVEMKENLAELTQLAEEKVISPEQLDMVKQMCDTIKTNKDRVDYLIYLLHKPVKKSKQKWYSKRNDKLIKELQANNADLDSVKAENQACLNKMKNI